MDTESDARPGWTGAVAWILLVIVSLLLEGYGIVHAGWHIWLPSPAEQDQVFIASRYVIAGCALSFLSAGWSHVRGNPVWVSVCVGLPGILVGWATLMDPYSLLRYLAAVVSFPLALSGIAEVIWAGGHPQRGWRPRP